MFVATEVEKALSLSHKLPSYFSLLPPTPCYVPGHSLPDLDKPTTSANLPL